MEFYGYLIFLLITGIILLIGLKYVKPYNKLVKAALGTLFSGILFLFLLELTFATHFRMINGYWLISGSVNQNKFLFEEAPYTVVRNRKNIDVSHQGVRFQHNVQGYRDEDFSQKKGATRILSLGGSTTYGVGVDNTETWPALLDKLTGPDTSVFNLGTPGHSTIENLITASFDLDELRPDVILLHVGLNDLRVSNIRPLQQNYSNFHAPDMYGSMGQCYLNGLPQIASLNYLIRWMQKLEWYPVCAFHRMQVDKIEKGGLDSLALGYYKRNLKSLLMICKDGAKDVILLPQILIPEMVESGKLNWWIPGVKPTEIVALQDIYNKATKQIADSMGCKYITELTDFKWTTEMFADPSHLNEVGNHRFAQIVANELNKKGEVKMKN